MAISVGSNRSTRPRWLDHYYNNFRTGILSFRVSHERIAYLFTRLNSRSLGTDMTDRSPFSPLRLSRRMISPVCFLYASRMSNRLSTCSLPSFLLSSSSDLFSPISFSPYHSFSPWNHQHCSQVPLLTQSGGFHLRVLVHRGEPNRTKPSTYGAQTTTEDTAGAVSIFCHPSVRERERSSGRFHRGGRCRVYVDL